MNDDPRKPDLRVVPKAMRNPTAMDDDELAEELSQVEAVGRQHLSDRMS